MPSTGNRGRARMPRFASDAGGVTFGVNGIVTQGAGARLHVGDAVELTLRF